MALEFKSGMIRLPPKVLLASGLVLGVLVYLYAGTGLHSDDYDFVAISQNWSLADWLVLYKASSIYLYGLPNIYFDFAQTLLFRHHTIYYDLVKVAVSCFGIFAAWLYARQYMESRRALLFAMVFILFPLHDATNYWFIGTYMIMTGAWVMLSHVLISRGRVGAGMAAGFAGAFWSYASPPMFGGLSVPFLLKRDFRKFFLFVLPEMLYVVYYLGVSRLTEAGNFHPITSPLKVVKQFVLQVGSFVDVAIGPSFWLKIYFSIFSLEWLSLLAGLLLALFFLRLYPQSREPVNRQMLLACIAVTQCAFLVYALTGMYPQMAFNLGDRVTYFGCLLLAFLLVSVPFPRVAVGALFLVLALSITGLSNHWKNWNRQQEKIAESIGTNPELLSYNRKMLFVSGCQYSHLGLMSHIEFFSASDVVQGVFSYAQGRLPPYQVIALNKQHYWEGGAVHDRKFGGEILVGERVFVYDAEKNKLLDLPASELNRYIDALPAETRHWVQLLPDGVVRHAVLYLMPRLQYAFI